MALGARIVVAAMLAAWVIGRPLQAAESPVVFPSEAVPFARPANLKQTMLLRPSDGTGPFPAIVLLPTCAGMQPHMLDWAERLTQDGYVTLLVEINTARGVRINCSKSPPVKYDQAMTDAIAALAHLRRLPIVRRDRLGVMGLSFGGGVALRMAGAAYQKEGAFADGLRAIASFYPWCDRTGREFNSSNLVTEGLPGDIVTPTMIFIGELDDETRPLPCTERVDRMKTQGKPISYKLYPETTHAFDNKENGLAGRRVPSGYFYRYNPQATEDSWRELKAFFDREIKQAR
jgi:dienelactone hydrolase